MIGYISIKRPNADGIRAFSFFTIHASLFTDMKTCLGKRNEPLRVKALCDLALRGSVMAFPAP